MIGLIMMLTAAPVQAPAAIPWGKANTANLAAMARPADLAQPVPMGPANGQLEAAAVTRLLADKAKDLRRENGGQNGGQNGSAPQ